MPTYIIKPTREDDFFIAYSTVTDSVHAWGTRDEFINGTCQWFRGRDDADIPERLARASTFGTSDFVRMENFDSGPLLVRWSADGSEEVGAHLIDRADIRKWLDGADDTLLRPITYEDE